jgi:hypothetical protein
VIVENFDLETFKTRPFGKLVEQRGWQNSVFVDTPTTSTNMFFASRNIPGLLFYDQRKYVVLCGLFERLCLYLGFSVCIVFIGFFGVVTF